MGPIEILYLTIGIIVVLIGLARGYVKELGSTLIILVALFILTFFKEPVDAALGATAQGAFGSEEGAGPELFLSLFYTIVFVAIVFTGYAGRTLTFGGHPLRRRKACCSACWSASSTAISSPERCGTTKKRTATRSSSLSKVNLPRRRRPSIAFLPPSLFEDNPVYWIIPVAILLIIRVRG